MQYPPFYDVIVSAAATIGCCCLLQMILMYHWTFFSTSLPLCQYFSLIRHFGVYQRGMITEKLVTCHKNQVWSSIMDDMPAVCEFCRISES
jgi:hypothetical protein